MDTLERCKALITRLQAIKAPHDAARNVLNEELSKANAAYSAVADRIKKQKQQMAGTLAALDMALASANAVKQIKDVGIADTVLAALEQKAEELSNGDIR
jgi:ABC-type branched-subunit amino acid transport system substrate-binding protein